MKNVMLLHPSVWQQIVVEVFTHVFEKPATGINGFVTSILNVSERKNFTFKVILSTIRSKPLLAQNIFF
jgi:hypothetical protein